MVSARPDVVSPSTVPSAGSEVACHECGMVHHRQALVPGSRARCGRCGHRLYEHRPASFDQALALTFAAAFLYVVANVYPFLGFQMGSQVMQTTLFSGAVQLYDQGRWGLAVVVAVTSVVAPGLQLLGLLYVLVPARLGRAPADLAAVFRGISTLGPWAMMDVFLLGILVSVVKLSDMARILPGPGLAAFVALTFVMAWVQVSIDPERIWSLVPVRLRPYDAVRDRAALLHCHSCHLTVATPAAGRGAALRCPRCGVALHRRKPDSLQRSWALLLAACLCYVPANVLPIMHVTSLGRTQSDTIMSGVLYLLHHGQWPLAAIVFVASVFVPVLKIVLLAGLLLSIHLRVRWRPVDRTRLYRMTEAVGRWSMVDIYVVTILVALVQLGNLATIEAGWGAVYFAAVVILTMFAAMSFEPRLMWDRMEEAQA